ncbi:MAG: DUF3486 family protein [Magnetospirillum sp.]|nr:DUF3486 family protein [Magnetospirillum sp.]
MAGKPSKADRLPGPLKEALAELWYSQRYTLDQIKAWLDDVAAGRRSLLPPELAKAAEGVAVSAEDLPSRSGLGRHFQGLDKLADRLQRSRTVAEALVRQLGDAPESRQARLNIELAHTMVTDVFLKADEAVETGEAVTLDAGTIHDLAKALDHLTRAADRDQAATLKLRRELRAELAKKVDQVKGEARRTAMTPEEALERVRALYTGEG